MVWKIKKRSTIVAISAVALSMGAAYADDKFTGFYKGINAQNGSIDQKSIVKMADGTYDIRTSSTALGACGDGREPGLVTAVGRADRRQLVREQVVATCLETGNTVELSNGVYVLQHDDNVLAIETGGDRVNHYHRMTDD